MWQLQEKYAPPVTPLCHASSAGAGATTVSPQKQRKTWEAETAKPPLCPTCKAKRKAKRKGVIRLHDTAVSTFAEG